VELTLRPIEAADVEEVQRLYEAMPDVFKLLIGRPAPPDQSANDYDQALKMPGRVRYAVVLDNQIIGLADCKFDDATERLAHIGLLALAPPYDQDATAALVLRILSRWFARLGVTRVQTLVPAHSARAIAFWTSQGFTFTGGQLRRELPGYAPRFLALTRDLDFL